MIYCVKCKSKTADVSATSAVAKNGKKMMKAKCVKCGTTKSQFVGGGIGSLLSSFF